MYKRNFEDILNKTKMCNMSFIVIYQPMSMTNLLNYFLQYHVNIYINYDLNIKK